eukprot:Pgem_evm1s14812
MRSSFSKEKSTKLKCVTKDQEQNITEIKQKQTRQSLGFDVDLFIQIFTEAMKNVTKAIFGI